MFPVVFIAIKVNHQKYNYWQHRRYRYITGKVIAPRKKRHHAKQVVDKDKKEDGKQQR